MAVATGGVDDFRDIPGSNSRWPGVVFATSLLVASAIAQAQPVGKVFRIGLLGLGNAPAGAIERKGDFQQGLRDQRYVDGKNVVVELRYAGGNLVKLADLANELVRMKVDVIVTSGEPAAFAAKRATDTIPIVATEFGLDPVHAGLVTSLRRPGGNITGLASVSEELWKKRLQAFRTLVPKISRPVVLLNPANSGNQSCFDEIQRGARELGMHVTSVAATDDKSLQQAFTAIVRERPDSLVICWDNVTLEHAKAIADFALKQQLPTLAPLKEYVEAGSLLSYGMSLAAHRRRAAYYVDKILNGGKPADFPVERPTTFEMVANTDTAKALRLTIPPEMMMVLDAVVP